MAKGSGYGSGGGGAGFRDRSNPYYWTGGVGTGGKIQLNW